MGDELKWLLKEGGGCIYESRLSGQMVGYMSIEMSWYFLECRTSHISCKISEKRKHSEKDLEIPCTYVFTGKQSHVQNLIELFLNNLLCTLQSAFFGRPHIHYVQISSLCMLLHITLFCWVGVFFSNK